MRQQKAFTLIELMVVIAITGIIAAIGYPSYTSHIATAKRADAKGALVSFANAMERRMTEANSYCHLGNAAPTSGDCGTAADSIGAPIVFAKYAPIDAPDVSKAAYTLTISAVSKNSYTLSATPVNNQASDSCGGLTLTNTGVRGVTGTGATVANCW